MLLRDGHTTSLWQASFDNYTPQNTWEPGTTYDALIVGGGITGITTALLLQQAGRRCVIAEAHSLCYGTSGATTAHLNTMLETPFHTVEKDFGEAGAKTLCTGLKEAIALVKSLDDTNSNASFQHKDAYLYAQTDKESSELDDIVAASLRAGCDVSFQDTIPVPDSFIKAAAWRGDAQIHATAYLLHLAQQFEAAGGVILQSCAVQGTTYADGAYTANTTLGSITAHHLVWATHIPPGINLLHFRCAPYRSYAAAFTLKEGIYPDALTYDMKENYHYFRTQEWGGKQYVIAGGFDHKTGHEQNTDVPFRSLEAYLRGLYEIEDYAYAWSSQYFVPTDGLPYIGHLPGGQEHTWCATGYGGNGMVLGTLAAITLRDLITTGESAYKELFSPSRIKPTAGFMDFVKENADVVKEFVGKRFSYEKISTLAELAPGEAKLADWEGKKIALYKDDAGKVHGVNPVCSHAKCIVGWNKAERSWDCPCHGARYTPAGELITGPAMHGLEPIIWEGIEGD